MMASGHLALRSQKHQAVSENNKKTKHNYTHKSVGRWWLIVLVSSQDISSLRFIRRWL